MKRFNFLSSLYTLTAFVVILERLSPTTKILLQPFHFVGLHELLQTFFFLPITIIISVLLLQLITNNFQTLKKGRNVFLLILFIVGVYFYAAGEGWHEIVGSIINQYCLPHHIISTFCQSLFVNYFYLGNIVFFVGGVFTTFATMALASQLPSEKFNNSDMAVLTGNSLVYGFSYFAYAAFDKVAIGLLFAVVLMIISFLFLFIVKGKIREYPYIISGVIAYSFATIATIIVRLHLF